MPVKFFPLDQILEPSKRFGGGLRYARNLIPAYDGWRSLRKRSIQTRNIDQERPINNAFQHIYTATQDLQFLAPANQETPFDLGTNARLSDDNEADADGFTNFPDYVGGTQPDDSKFVVVGGGADTVINLPLQNGSDGIIEPSSTSNWKTRIRYKVEGNASGTWSVTYRLMGSSTGELVASQSLASGTGGGTDGWVTYEDDFTGDLGWEVDHATEYVYIEVTPTTTAGNQIVVPTGESNTNNWTDADDGTTDIYESIDEGATADDDDYIKSPIIGTSGTTSYTANLAAVEPFYHAAATVSDAIKVRWKKPQAGGVLSAKLYQGTTLIADLGNIGTSAAQASFTTTNLSLTAAQWNSITDFTDLKVELTFTGGEPGVSLVSTTVAANDVLESGTWGSNTGGSDVLIGDINANGGQYAQTPYVSGPGIGTQVPMEIAFADYTYPGFDSGHSFLVDTDTDASSTQSANLKLFAGGQSLYNDDLSYPASEATQTISLDSGDVAKMRANAEDLTAVFAGQGTSDTTHLIVDFMRFSVPVPMEVYVSSVYLDFPPRAYAAVSWVQLQTPVGDTGIIDDSPTIYAGDKEKLWTVDLTGVAGFTDVSQAGDYGQTDKPRVWQFAQWGNDVIATNYVDPVQIRADSTGDFADMITSTKQPRARFVAVVRDQVWLGDTTDEAEASADGVWWSAVDDATDFDPAPTTQCDYQRLRQTPGQVMGLVGGEYAIIFKRDSIYRADYEGPPFFYSFKLLSTNEGTPFPRSIVPVERDVFFHTGGEFLVLRRGEGLERIQAPPINKYFDDKFAHPATSLFAAADQEFSKEDIGVFGAYDHHSNLIFWFLQNATYSGVLSSTTPAGYGTHHNICAVYDVKNGRWSDLRLSDNDLAYATALCSRMHWDYSGSYHNRSVVGFSYEHGQSTASTYYIDLDGVDGMANGGDIFDVQADDSLTFRIRFQTSDTGTQFLLSKGPSGGAGYGLQQTSDNLIAFFITDGVTTPFIETVGTYNNGAWHEVWAIIDRDRNLLRLRVGNNDTLDAAEADISAIGAVTNAVSFLVGVLSAGTFWNGNVDELAIWNRALSDEEIGERFGRPLEVGDDYISYYPMNENTGTDLVDLGPGGHNLALTGGFAWVSGGLPKSALVQTAWVFSDATTYGAEVKTNFFAILESAGTTVTGVRPVFTFEPEGTDITLSVTLTASETPSISGSTSTVSALLDEDGWYNVPSLFGEFFSITAVIPESSTLLGHEILGWEVRHAAEESE